MTDLAGKTMLVTGANTGIGRATAEALAGRGARVWLACRSRDKTEPVLAAIAAAGGNAEFIQLDLSDLAQVRRSADLLLARDEPLHVLINNAGLGGLRGTTTQGFELTFGTNHLGHFLLTARLLPRLRDSASAGSPSRVVNVASKAHYDAKRIDWAALQKKTSSLTGLREYQVSKLCNLLFTRELSKGKAGSGVRSFSLHPGVIASDAWRHVPWPVHPFIKRGLLTNEEGARTTLHCATSPEVLGEEDGLYYDECQPKRPSPLALDDGLSEELWRRSSDWVKEWTS